MDVVEIDPRVEQIARDFFRLRDNERLRIFHEDGRVFLNSAPAGTYDAVMIDAFGSLFSVPYQLTTREAVEQMSRVLNDRGVVIANIGSSINGEASRFLQAELATYRAVFPQVFVFKVRGERKDTDLQNLILLATKSNVSFEMTSPDAELNELLKRLYDQPIAIAEPVITDELAPVEFYNSSAQRYFLSSRQ